MSYWKVFGLAFFGVIAVLGETTGAAYAQCVPSYATAICATEWDGADIIGLNNPPGFAGGVANGINNRGQMVGYSLGNTQTATEWNGGSVSNLGGLPGSALRKRSITLVRRWGSPLSVAAVWPPSGAAAAS